MCLIPSFSALASGGGSLEETSSVLGYTCVGLFVFAYVFVILEEKLHMRKSKPVVLAACIIWSLVAILADRHGVDPKVFKEVLNHNLTEYAELLLFLLVAMTYINAMQDCRIFRTLRYWLILKKFSFMQLFWITGVIAFFLSPIADNLTTALLLGAVVASVGGDNKKFVSMACINIVCAANAGGAFSPFGDITTLMVWQAGKIEFLEFFNLFLPSLVNFLIPATIMTFFLPKGQPEGELEEFEMRKGAKRIVALFVLTIALAVGMKQIFHLPPYMGMMAGFSLLLLFGYYLKMSEHNRDMEISFNVFHKVEKAEWDTLFFFFGIIFSVGGLAYIGYLELVSHIMYDGYGPTVANIAAGVFSALIDNIPVMFAILKMSPEMGATPELIKNQWLLITLTAGVGGSLLSIGSAAGVALMGQVKGKYTFVGHLKWSWAIALGYIGSIYCHYLVNGF